MVSAEQFGLHAGGTGKQLRASEFARGLSLLAPARECNLWRVKRRRRELPSESAERVQRTAAQPGIFRAGAVQLLSVGGRRHHSVASKRTFASLHQRGDAFKLLRRALNNSICGSLKKS